MEHFEIRDITNGVIIAIAAVEVEPNDTPEDIDALFEPAAEPYGFTDPMVDVTSVTTEGGLTGDFPGYEGPILSVLLIIRARMAVHKIRAFIPGYPPAPRA